MRVVPSKKFIVCTTESKSKSGLIISEGEKEKPIVGVVYAIGEGKLPLPLEIGSRVIFRRYADNRVLIDGVEYNFVQFRDIVGVVEET